MSLVYYLCFFFFSSRRRHTRFDCDWSSDVCSSDLLSQTLAMINLDMIGRISRNRLYVGGTGTSPGFRKLVEEANSPPGFELSFSASGYGASDHTSFTVRGVPVLFFFSGLHSDYHKPSDTWDKIDAVDGARVVGLVAN